MASKKAEIRARRFAPRDKTKKRTVASTFSSSATTAGGIPQSTIASATKGVDEGVSPGAGEQGGEEGLVAQSLEALTRRWEVVTGDLLRTDDGLEELQAEEAEEALEKSR